VVGRGHDREKSFLHLFILEKVVKIFFSRTSIPISIKLGTNLSVKGIQVCSNKRPGPLRRGDNLKSAKVRWDHINKSFQKP
jgi:hypothetical protein